MNYHYLPYTLTLHAPVILTTIAGNPDRLRTLPYIPGSAIRGVVASRLGDPGKDADRQMRFRKLILDGRVCFLNAYPSIQGHRALPMPLSFRIDKANLLDHMKVIEAYDLASHDGEEQDGELDWPDVSLSPLAEPFFSLGADSIRIHPVVGSRTHQQRDRKLGRAYLERLCDGSEKRYGGLFSLEFLESEGQQTFEGVIAFREHDMLAELIQELKSLLPDQSRILFGRSRRGGYGGEAEIAWKAPRKREVIENHELIGREIGPGDCFRALLTSSYIGRNSQTGQLDPEYVEEELKYAFAHRVEVVRRRWSFEVTGGFNRKWRMEIPQAPACRAGAVLVLKAKERISFNDVLCIERMGLGERRTEGFGRVIFLGEARPTVRIEAPPQFKTLSQPSGNPPEIVQLAEKRIIEAELERCLKIEVGRLANASSLDSIPTSSLLGRLQNLLREHSQIPLDMLKAPAMKQLDRCRLGHEGEPLSTWLRVMGESEDEGRLASLLRYDALARRCYVISEETARQQLTRNPWIRKRCMQEMLAILARRKRQEAS